MSTKDTIESRLKRLESREEIRALAARYCVVMDDRDIDGIFDIFTADCAVRSKDGVMNAVGRDAVVDMYRGRFAALGVSNHFTHEHVITFDAADDSKAYGFLTAHAEVWRNGQSLVAAIRYNDVYRIEDGRWRFAERVLSFLYYVPVRDYADVLGSRLRQRAYGDQRPADYPESLPSWKLYHGDQ